MDTAAAAVTAEVALHDVAAWLHLPALGYQLFPPPVEPGHAARPGYQLPSRAMCRPTAIQVGSAASSGTAPVSCVGWVAVYAVGFTTYLGGDVAALGDEATVDGGVLEDE